MKLIGLCRRTKVVSLLCALLAITVGFPENSSSQVNPDKIAIEIDDAFTKVFEGKHDTHFSLPEQEPAIYALSFEFADALARKCPGVFPSTFHQQREIYWGAYVYYKTNRLGALPNLRGKTLSEAALAYIATIGDAALPVILKRKEIAVGITKYVDLLVGMVGCSSKGVRDLSGNLFAIGTFGKLIKHSFESRLLRKEDTDNKIGFICYYKGDDAHSEKRQGYSKIVVALRDSAAGGLVEGLQREIDKNRYGTKTPTPLPPFIRADCPLTIDPRFSVGTSVVLPGPPAPSSGTIEERMANYFVDQYIPLMGFRETKTKLGLSDTELKTLKHEIVKFESIKVSRSEIEAAINKENQQYTKSGLKIPDTPLQERRESFDTDIRIEKYKELHGTALFDLSRRDKGVPMYAMVRWFADPLRAIRIEQWVYP